MKYGRLVFRCFTTLSVGERSRFNCPIARLLGGLAVLVIAGCSAQSNTPSPIANPRPIQPASPPSMVKESVRAPVSTKATRPPFRPMLDNELTIPSEWQSPITVERVVPPEELMSRVDRALERRDEEVRPAVLIFPFINAAEAIRPDGPGLCLLASYAATYLPEQRLSLSPDFEQQLFRAAGCWEPGAVLDRDRIDQCVRHADADGFVIATILESSDRPTSYHLTVEFHGRNSKYRDARFEHDFTAQQLALAPSWVALDLLDHLGIALSAEQREAVQGDQVLSAADIQEISALSGGDERPDGAGWEALLYHNPGCVAAWAGYLQTTSRPERALAQFALLDPPLPSAGAQFALATCLDRIHRPEQALLLLLSLAPSHVGDSPYFAALARCALHLQDDALLAHLLEIWRTQDPGYVGCLSRGVLLSDWAESAEKTEQGALVDQPSATRGRDRWEMARMEWARAVTLDANDWIAHQHLLNVATPLRLPAEFVDEHFQAVARSKSYSIEAYRAKLRWLANRFTEAPGDFTAFARHCVESGMWREGIPQLVPAAIHFAAVERRSSALRHSLYRSDELWSLVTLYFEAARSQALTNEFKNEASLAYLRWGALGGRHRELYANYVKIRSELLWGRGGEQAPGFRHELFYLLDLVESRAGWGNYRALATAMIAISEGDVPATEQALEQLRPDPAESGITADNLRAQARFLARAAQFARRLQSERRVRLAADELEPILGELTSEAFWSPFSQRSVEGDKLVIRIVPRYRGEREFLLPFGIGPAVVSGVLEWSPGVTSVDILAHTRSPRDVLRMEYSTASRTVRLIRNGERLQQAELREGPQAFHMEYGTRQDELSPCVGVRWSAAVVDVAPSGLGFRFIAPPETGPHTLSISELTIELLP